MKYEPPRVDRTCVRGFQRIVEGKLTLPKRNEWKSWSDNELWLEIVGEIAVWGDSSGWENLRDSGDDLDALGIDSSRRVARKGGRKALVERVNNIFIAHKVRFASKKEGGKMKAKAVADNFLSKKVVTGKRFTLLRNLVSELKKQKGIGSSGLKYERKARELLSSRDSPLKLNGFNLKSASDYLITIGFAKHLVPIDSNIKDMIEAICDLEGFSDYSIPSGGYERWEDFMREVASRLGIKPFELDRRLYASARGWHMYLED